MEENRTQVTLTETEAKQLQEQGEKFFTTSEFAKLIGKSEKALRQMRFSLCIRQNAEIFYK